MNSALYTGWVSHRRRLPRTHAFRYPLFMVWLDLAELDQVFRGRWLWGVERRTLAAFRRADHLGEAARPLDACVRELVEAETGRRPVGPIRLLTHLRYFGYCFNPVSFYYCFDTQGERVDTVVAEVNNTPWGERHCYVLDRPPDAADGALRWRSEKRLHVSPFMPMDLEYEWRLTAPVAAVDAPLTVRMVCRRGGQRLFDAALSLRRRPLAGTVMAATLLKFPWMTLKVVMAIHWQALLLWLKRVPVYTHPATGVAVGNGVTPPRTRSSAGH